MGLVIIICVAMVSLAVLSIYSFKLMGYFGFFVAYGSFLLANRLIDFLMEHWEKLL